MSAPAIAREHVDVDLGLLDPPELDLRDGRDEAQLDEITNSIARIGIQQPLVTFRNGDRFQIIDGLTRYLCAQRLNLKTVPCYVYASRVDCLESIKYDTAVMRLELTPAEEATYFHHLFLGECREDIDAVAARVGRSRAYVDSRIALLLGDEEVFNAVRAGEINLGIAQALNSITDQGWRRFYLKHAIKSGATRAVVIGWVQEWKTTQDLRVDQPAAPAQAAAPVTQPSDHNPNACVVCGESNNHIPLLIPVHDYCKLAILDKLLAVYRNPNS